MISNETARQISVKNIVRIRRYLTTLIVGITLSLSFGLFGSVANAAIDVYEFDTPQQEAQYRALIEEFRCPKCQNQNLAGSDSQISQDLKRKTYQMVMAGQTDAQIREYMYERYGDFISYRPPVRPSTWILWFFPPLILIILISWWLWRSGKFGQASRRVQVATGTNGTNIYPDGINGNAQTNVNDIGSELSEEESAKLKALLKQHGSVNSSVNSSADNQTDTVIDKKANIETDTAKETSDNTKE